jgi:hypothetical protein
MIYTTVMCPTEIREMTKKADEERRVKAETARSLSNIEEQVRVRVQAITVCELVRHGRVFSICNRDIATTTACATCQLHSTAVPF